MTVVWCRWYVTKCANRLTRFYPIFDDTIELMKLLAFKKFFTCAELTEENFSLRRKFGVGITLERKSVRPPSLEIGTTAKLGGMIDHTIESMCANLGDILTTSHGATIFQISAGCRLRRAQKFESFVVDRVSWHSRPVVPRPLLTLDRS